MPKGQSVAARRERCTKGRCPLHGLRLAQVDGWYYPRHGKPYTIVGCPHPQCEVQAKAFSIDGAWELLPHCAHLVRPALWRVR
jgi:hypothetical protein